MALVTLGEKKGTKIGGAANQIPERLHHKTVNALSGALLKAKGQNVSSKNSVQQEIRYRTWSRSADFKNKILNFASIFSSVRHVTGWDEDYLRKIPRVVW